MGLKEVLATNVRYYRKNAHLSQEELAEQAGLDRTYIGRVEQGGNVTLKSLERIAAAFGFDPIILLLDHAALPTAASEKSPAEQDVFALVQWTQDNVTIHPLNAYYDDLTIKVLLDLIERGHRGDDLLEAYNDTCHEIMSFLDGNEQNEPHA